MESVLLSARCTANTATVFWNKPENANADTVYEVSLDGGHSVHTNRTHYTFTELIPNTEYCVTVSQYRQYPHLYLTCTAPHLCNRRTLQCRG